MIPPLTEARGSLSQSNSIYKGLVPVFPRCFFFCDSCCFARHETICRTVCTFKRFLLNRLLECPPCGFSFSFCFSLFRQRRNGGKCRPAASIRIFAA